MKNLVLIGMPGVGKSTVGVVLAKILAYEFLDSDLVIQKKEGCRLHELITREGVEGFIQLEDQINASIDVKSSIIATGGSAVYGENAMNHFKSTGTIIYLKASFETLSKRLGDLKHRGVVMKEGQTLIDIYNERCPLYEKYADIVIDEDNLSVELTIDKILEALGETP